MPIGDRLVDRLATRPPPGPVLNGLLRFRRRLRRMRERPLPAHAVIIDRSFVLIECAAIGIAAELDLAEHVQRGKHTTEDLARATGTDPDALARLMEVLVAIDVFARRRDGTWRQTRLSEILRDDHPSSMRGWARFFGGPDMFRIWTEGAHSIRTGQSATAAATGHEFFEYLHEVAPGAGERFDAAMRDGSRAVAQSFAEIVALDGVQTICDVGGGTGMLVRSVLDRHPGMRGVVFDLPEVIARAHSAPGEDDRVDFVAGSFFDRVPSADRIVLVSIVHDWDDERASAILAKCRDALPGGGRVLVVESTLDPSRPPFIERSSDLLMLVITGAGRERTREDFERLFATAGLRVETTSLLASLQTVYELVPSG